MKEKKVTSKEVTSAYNKWADESKNRYTTVSAEYIIGQIDAAFEKYMAKGYTKIHFDPYPKEIEESKYEIIKKELEERGFMVMSWDNKRLFVYAGKPSSPGRCHHIEAEFRE